MRVHTPQQQFNQATKMADDHGMYVVDKSMKTNGRFKYFVYRKTVPKPTMAGKCSTPKALFTLVNRLSKTAK
jgi:hypothetical protein